MARKLCTFLTLLIFLLGLHSAPVTGRELSYEYRDSEVRAAFLYNFVRFVSWPGSAFADEQSPLVVCIEDPGLFRVASRNLIRYRVHRRPVRVKRFSGAGSDCRAHVLVLAEQGAAEWPALRDSLQGLPVLTISGQADFAASGGMLEWIREGRRLHFGVNLAATRQSGLVLSSEVLRLADFVYRPGGEVYRR